MNVTFQTIAQLAQDNQVLYTYGPLGVITAWFMWRGEKLGNTVVSEIRELSHRIDGMTRAMLADVISRDGVGQHTQSIARDMLAKIEARDRKV